MHICFFENTYNALERVLKEDKIKGEGIVGLFEDLSYGDLNRGIEPQNLKGDFEKLETSNEITIWYGNNPKEYCNLYYLIDRLRDKNINVICCDFKEEKGKTLFYKWSSEVIDEDLPDFYKGRIRLGKEEKESCIKLFESLKNKNRELRVIEGNNIKSVSKDYYDEILLEYIRKYNGKKSVLPIGMVIGDDNILHDDEFFKMRLIELEKLNKIKINWVNKDMYFNEVEIV